ncbi:MAG: TetR/AcrR family transcriptional regulator [Halanaerobium sp.]
MTNTKEKILNSAVNLFSKNNYHAVSMNQIAEDADLSKGTLYWHFDSKEELFSKILIRGIDYFKKRFREILNSEQKTEDKIYSLVEIVVNTFSENMNLIILFKNNSPIITQELEDKKCQHQGFLDIISQIIEEGIKRGAITAKKANELSLMVLSILFSDQIIRMLRNNSSQKQLQKTIDFIYDFIMYGITGKESN